MLYQRYETFAPVFDIIQKVDDLIKQYPNIQTNIPLSKLTTTQIGGPAKFFFEAKTESELIEILKFVHQNHIEYLVIGGGSNLLVNDNGVDFLVIKNSTKGITEQNNNLLVQSGTPLQDLVDYTIAHQLEGLHKLTGIPGTVGGAIYGNAGAFGQTISDHLTKVLTFDGEKILEFTNSECNFDYRTSLFKQNKERLLSSGNEARLLSSGNKFTILNAYFKLSPSNLELLTQESSEILQTRLKRWPKGMKCPGSFFKNVIAEKLPKHILEKIPREKIIFGKIPAGYLLEQVGAKGSFLGGVAIANYHGNAFINTGNGTAKAYLQLASSLAKLVEEKFGIELEPEVQFINLPPLKF